MKGFIIATKNYRYFTMGNLKNASKIVFVLHGYGQLSEFFIRKFQKLSEEYFIVAPEGMHRFYLKGSSGRVGASWMTKEERDLDIEDNLNWLNQLFQEFWVKKQFNEKIVLGFSQGGATAARWYYQGISNFDKLIIWSSVFPPDLQIEKEIKKQNQKKNNSFVIGTADEFYSKEQIEDLISFYDSKGFKSITYNGNHDIEPAILTELLP